MHNACRHCNHLAQVYNLKMWYCNLEADTASDVTISTSCTNSSYPRYDTIVTLSKFRDYPASMDLSCPYQVEIEIEDLYNNKEG